MREHTPQRSSSISSTSSPAVEIQVSEGNTKFLLASGHTVKWRILPVASDTELQPGGSFLDAGNQNQCEEPEGTLGVRKPRSGLSMILRSQLFALSNEAVEQYEL